MQRTLPLWFQADQVFSHNGNWYFGSVDNLHIGPYRSRDIAESKSNQVANRLRQLNSDEARLSYVRKLLHEEWEQILPGASPKETVGEIDLTPPLVKVRDGEGQKTWYRSERFFHVDGVWLFATREGIDVGPFDSELEAKQHERRLVSLLARARTPEEAYRIIYEYKHRPATVAAH
jgi:hypothetical protein